MAIFRRAGRPVFPVMRFLLVVPAALLASCDDGTSTHPYYVVEPGTSFSHYQLQCAVNAISDQREAAAEMRQWERCQDDLPRLEALQSELREEWKAAELEKWNSRCANEIGSLRAACERKRDEALADLPDHLRVPPQYSTALERPPINVAEYRWRDVQNESDLQTAAALIVMDEVEARSKLFSNLMPTVPPSTSRPLVQTQREKDLRDVRVMGYCAKWIGRTAPDADRLTEEYLGTSIERCRAP